MASNKVIVELNGRLVGDGYTLPIATPERLGVIRVGDGLDIDSDGILKVIPIEHNAFSKLSVKHSNGEINKTATTREDVIKLSFNSALEVENIDGVPTINLNFGTYLDKDKPMSGAAVKEYADGLLRGLSFEFGELEEWLNSLYLSTDSYVSAQIYEVVTDSGGNATLPFILEDNSVNFVFINGLLATEGKDYQFLDNSIQLTVSDFSTGDDVVALVVLKSIIDGKTGESKTIKISSDIYETATDEDGYSLLPFVYDNQIFQVFINGVLALRDKDYSIVNDNSGVQILNSEFSTGDDIVTFVVLKTNERSNEDNTDINILSEVYEIETDSIGRAKIPLMPKLIIKNYDSSTVHVYINGLFAVEGKDYTIENDEIQLNNLMFDSGNDIITFIVFKTEGTVDDEEISVSDIEKMASEIDGLK